MGAGKDTVLVTGGAGFIGSHVTSKLCAEGANVEIVDNLLAGERDLVPDDATLHEVDIRDAEALGTVVESVDPTTIVHLAAIHYIPYCNENPEEAFDVNVVGTRHLLDAARELDGLERLVYSSTAAVYPPRDGPNPADSPTGPMDVYGRTKLVGEDLVRLFHEETGVPAVSARLFNTYGPNETNAHLIPAILEQIEAGDREIELGNLSPKRDFTHVDDVARALVTLLEFDGGYEVYNVGAGEPRSVREVVSGVEQALGEEITIEQDDERVRESDRPHLEADISNIRADTGWEPEMTFVDGLQDLLRKEGIANV